MSKHAELTELSLSEAVVLWCDQDMVDVVVRAEAYFTKLELHNAGRFHLGGARGLGSRQVLRDSHDGVHEAGMLNYAWDTLLENFRRRIHLGQIYLRGTQTRPERQNSVSPIPSVWAHDFEFNFFKDAVTFSPDYRFTGVIASRTPPIESAGQLSSTRVTPETVAALSDDDILAVLEEHAKRVVENDAKLFPPGKISLMPIIRRKMQHRASKNEMLGRLGEEMAWLAVWIASKIPSYQVPTARALANALRKDYAACKAQSNGTMT